MLKSPARSRRSVDRVRWRSPALLLIFALFGLYYYWAVQPHVWQRFSGHGVYNELTDSFIEGHVSLLRQPDPRLSQLPNPYDPVANLPYRIHDMSLYKQKLYVYFGPAPAVTLFWPFRLIFGRELPDPAGAAVFATGAFIASCLALKIILTEFYPSTRSWLYYLLCCTMGFCNTFPFLLRRPAVYEVAITAGQCFLCAGLALILRAVLAKESTFRIISFTAGIMFGAAIAARASMILPAALLLTIVFWRRPLRFGTWVPAALPIAAALVGLAAYNYARFDSPFEFGSRYQLAGIDITKVKLFNPARIPRNTALFLVYPPGLSATFPFVAVRTPAEKPGSIYLGFEAVTGILWLSPLLILIPFAPVLLKSDQKITLAWLLGVLIGAGLILMLLNAALAVTMRYESDFSTLLFLAAATVAVGLVQAARQKAWIVTAIVSLSVIGITSNAAIGLTGYYGGLHVSAPEQFAFLKSTFTPVSWLLRTAGVGEAH